MCIYFAFFDNVFRSGVKGIGALGVALTVLYILLSFLGGKEIFLLLSYFNVNHVYFATFTCVFNIFVHLLLWHGWLTRNFDRGRIPGLEKSNFVSGAEHKQKYKLLPWLVFVMLKAMIFLSVGISATTRFIRRVNQSAESGPSSCPGLSCPTGEMASQEEDPTRSLQFTVIMYIYFMAGETDI